jgi:rSAM/selenodomain-associated transferase 1
LRTALLADVIGVIAALDDVDRFIFFTPDEAEAEMAAMAGPSFSRRSQRGRTLGHRMQSAFEALLVDRGYASAILVGSDIPLMTDAHIDGARHRLRDPGDVVLGPADDGGYYLIGMRRVEPRLFDGIEWGSERVMAETVRAAERAGLTPQIGERAYDIDRIEDLRRLERDLLSAPADVAPNTRRWLRAGKAGWAG